MAWPRLPTALRFRTQIVAVVVGAVALTVVVSLLGLNALGTLQAAQMLARLSPAARRAVEKLEAQQVPNEADLEALMLEAADQQVEADFGQNIGLVVLASLGAVVGGATGVFLAARFARPVEAVAEAARAIAAGRLAARITTPHRGTGETAQLVADFNAMADALEKAERELRESSAAIAHELRTPLTVLRGRLQGIADGVFATGPKEISGLIRQVEALTRIVDDLRVLSLASVGALELRLAPVDLADEVDAALTLYTPDIAAKGLKIERALAPAPAFADPARIHQLTAALFENALRYAAEGGFLRVEVAARPTAAVLRVLDHGPGFAPEDLPRVFERFWRADASRSRAVGGSGLGLSVVRAITEAHGGACSADNGPSGGAIIEITLPRFPQTK